MSGDICGGLMLISLLLGVLYCVSVSDTRFAFKMEGAVIILRLKEIDCMYIVEFGKL